MPQLYAQPYDTSATGFFFESTEEYQQKAARLRNSSGLPVEEFEIQFIDGEDIDAELFRALGIHQGSFSAFLERVDEWSESDKQKVIIAAGECGYRFDPAKDSPDDLDVDIYEMDSLRDLAVYFVEEGLYGEIPEQLQYYIDYEAIGRDLGMDYAETRIAGKNLIYRC